MIDDIYVDDSERMSMQAAVARKAGQRVSFDLRYGRTERRREFDEDFINAEPIDDAFRPGHKSPGGWSIGDRPIIDADNTVEWWISTFAEAAVQEAVHEALEWFQVDGKPWMNPHGIHEDRIMSACHEFFLRLRKIREQTILLDEDNA